MKKTAEQIAVSVLRKLAEDNHIPYNNESFYRDQVPADYPARYISADTDTGETANGYEDRHLQQSISGGPAPAGARLFPREGYNFNGYNNRVTQSTP